MNHILNVERTEVRWDNRIIVRESSERIEINDVYGGDNGEKYDCIKSCFLYQTLDEDELIITASKIKKLNVDGVLIIPRDEKVYIDGFEFRINDDICFDVASIYHLGVTYRTGEYMSVTFSGMIDNDMGYEKELNYKYHYPHSILENHTRDLVIKHIPYRGERLQKIVDVINGDD